jgi:tetratricopeptide (TPR) repeat protein
MERGQRRHKFRRLGGAVAAIVLAMGSSAGALAQTDPIIEQGNQLVAAGKLKEAYELLAPHEFDYSGNPKFDLLYGYAALETGNPSIASLAFERVLAVEPNNPEAHLHLARAYLALNDPNSAQREFETLLAINPTQSIRETVGQYLAGLKSHQPTSKLQLSGYLETSAGYDSNVTGATARNPISIPINPGQLQLLNTSTQEEAPFAQLGAGGTALYAFSPDVVGYVGADVISRMNGHGIPEVNYKYFAGRAGASKQFGNNNVRVGGNASHFDLDGGDDRQSAGGELEYRHTFNDRLQAGVVGGFTAYRYVLDSARSEDYNLYSLSASAVHLLGEKSQHLLSLSFDYGHEDDLHNRADGNRDYFGARLAAQAQITSWVNAYATVGYQLSDYDKTNAIFATKRDERQWNSAFGLNFLATPTFVIRPAVTYLDQSSDIPLYEYDRLTVSLTAHVDFL